MKCARTQDAQLVCRFVASAVVVVDGGALTAKRHALTCVRIEVDDAGGLTRDVVERILLGEGGGKVAPSSNWDCESELSVTKTCPPAV